MRHLKRTDSQVFRAVLNENGLVLGSVQRGRAEFKTVYQQSPRAGEWVAEGLSVDIWVR